MGETIRPVVVVSRCLGFESCRYNGQTIRDRFVERLGEHVEYRTVCPEVAIGLGVPREPIRIALSEGAPRLYQPATGRDVTAEMEAYTAEYLDGLGEVEGFLLKNRSPSCGARDVKIYQSMKKEAHSVRGAGVFGGAVAERFPGIPLEDEGRLKNFTIREHFLTQLFTLARFRRARAQGTMAALMEFQAQHKLLFLAYNETRMRAMGRVLANHEGRGLDEVIRTYGEELLKVLAHPPRYTAMINSLLHAFGGVSKELSVQERTFFLNSLEEYRDERLPLSVLLHLLRSWAIRFERKYLLDQALFEPYPLELVEITDSGKGRSR